jgi:hypothetical protein
VRGDVHLGPDWAANNWLKIDSQSIVNCQSTNQVASNVAVDSSGSGSGKCMGEITVALIVVCLLEREA